MKLKSDEPSKLIIAVQTVVGIPHGKADGSLQSAVCVDHAASCGNPRSKNQNFELYRTQAPYPVAYVDLAGDMFSSRGWSGSIPFRLCTASIKVLYPRQRVGILLLQVLRVVRRSGHSISQHRR